MSKSIADISQRQAARIAGLAYLAGIVLALYANFFVSERLINPDDVAATVSNITNSELVFRSGIVAFMAVIVADVVAGWALYVFFKPLNRDLSMLTAWIRLFYAAVHGAALLYLVAPLLLLERGQSDAQVMVSLDTFTYGWGIALVFFGVHLLLLGYLALKSDNVPRILGVLLVLAGAGYVVNYVASILLPTYENYRDLFFMLLAIMAAPGEFSLTGWLLLRGGKQRVPAMAHAT
jgi:hypothetical protein